MINIWHRELPIGFGLGKTEEHWRNIFNNSRTLKLTYACARDVIDSECDRDILTIHEVAQALKCSPDSIRRVSRTDLPARQGPGRMLLYLREDLVQFVRNLPGTQRRGSGFGATTNYPDESLCAEKHKEFDIKQAKSMIASG